jgi:diadenosine tetraphosphate (Ap4A) HIT family hydrolase
MGSEADYHDGAALLEILEREGVSDTDDISADDWSRMIEEAAKAADKARAEKPY